MFSGIYNFIWVTSMNVTMPSSLKTDLVFLHLCSMRGFLKRMLLVSSNLGFSGAKGGNTVWGHISLGIWISGRHISSFVFVRNFKEGGSGVKTAYLDCISMCLFASLRSLSLIQSPLFLSFLVRDICAIVCLYSKVLLSGLLLVLKFSYIGLLVHQFVCCCKHKHSEPA